MSVGCTPDPVEAINPSICDNNGNTEDDWYQVTTPPPQTNISNKNRHWLNLNAMTTSLSIRLVGW
jgi:hypothetical protein